MLRAIAQGRGDVVAGAGADNQDILGRRHEPVDQVVAAVVGVRHLRPEVDMLPQKLR